MRRTVFAVIAAVMAVTALDGYGDSKAQAALQKRLKETVVPKLDFRDAHLRDVADYLSQVSGERLNVVIGEAAAAASPTVTLTLRNVPLYDVFRYVCEVTDSQLRVDDHAIVITPGKGTPPNTYGVRLKVAPVAGEANQFMVEFLISEKQPDGEENLLSTPKLTMLGGTEGTIKVVDEGEKNGVICTATVIPKANELQVDTSVTIKEDGRVLWSCSQETTVAK